MFYNVYANKVNIHIIIICFIHIGINGIILCDPMIYTRGVKSRTTVNNKININYVYTLERNVRLRCDSLSRVGYL